MPGSIEYLNEQDLQFVSKIGKEGGTRNRDKNIFGCLGEGGTGIVNLWIFIFLVLMKT